MNTINKTDIFDEWLSKLKDHIGKVGILQRIERAKAGNFGDCKLLSDTGGVYEMRIFKGNGYRIYYAQEGETVYLLLIGGSKDSQSNDIDKAKILWQTIQEQIHE